MMVDFRPRAIAIGCVDACRLDRFKPRRSAPARRGSRGGVAALAGASGRVVAGVERLLGDTT